MWSEGSRVCGVCLCPLQCARARACPSSRTFMNAIKRGCQCASIIRHLFGTCLVEKPARLPPWQASRRPLRQDSFTTRQSCRRTGRTGRSSTRRRCTCTLARAWWRWVGGWEGGSDLAVVEALLVLVRMCRTVKREATIHGAHPSALVHITVLFPATQTSCSMLLRCCRAGWCTRSWC